MRKQQWNLDQQPPPGCTLKLTETSESCYSSWSKQQETRKHETKPTSTASLSVFHEQTLEAIEHWRITASMRLFKIFLYVWTETSLLEGTVHDSDFNAVFYPIFLQVSKAFVFTSQDNCIYKHLWSRSICTWSSVLLNKPKWSEFTWKKDVFQKKKKAIFFINQCSQVSRPNIQKDLKDTLVYSWSLMLFSWLFIQGSCRASQRTVVYLYTTTSILVVSY